MTSNYNFYISIVFFVIILLVITFILIPFSIRFISFLHFYRLKDEKLLNKLFNYSTLTSSFKIRLLMFETGKSFTKKLYFVIVFKVFQVSHFFASHSFLFFILILIYWFWKWKFFIYFLWKIVYLANRISSSVCTRIMNQ